MCKTPPLPGNDIFEPGDIEFYLWGHLEGRRTEDFRTSVRTDFGRQKRWCDCDDLYIIGPHGPTYGCCPGNCPCPAPSPTPCPAAGREQWADDDAGPTSTACRGTRSASGRSLRMDDMHRPNVNRREKGTVPADKGGQSPFSRRPGWSCWRRQPSRAVIAARNAGRAMTLPPEPSPSLMERMPANGSTRRRPAPIKTSSSSTATNGQRTR